MTRTQVSEKNSEKQEAAAKYVKGARPYTFFIGIDVSRNTLDFAVFNIGGFVFHQERKNEPADILDFLDSLSAIPSFKLRKALFCMENTGLYGNHLSTVMHKRKIDLVIEHPLRIKNSIGIKRYKDDRSDSIAIARYAMKNKDELMLWQPRRPVVENLRNLFSLRRRLLKISLMLATPAKEMMGFCSPETKELILLMCTCSLESVKSDLSKVESEMKLIVASDSDLNRMMTVARSVPSIGFLTALQIIISTNEFRDIDHPRKFACLAGIAPFKKESGLKSFRPKVSNQANKEIKVLLHLSALRAIRLDPQLKAYYDRKVAEGKPKKSVLNALRNKIVLRVFSCCKRNEEFRADYLCEREVVQGTSGNAFW